MRQGRQCSIAEQHVLQHSMQHVLQHSMQHTVQHSTHCNTACSIHSSTACSIPKDSMQQTGKTACPPSGGDVASSPGSLLRATSQTASL